MPFVRFAAPATFPFAAPASDPLVDFLTAALASETPTHCQQKSKPTAAPQCAPRRRIVKRYINPNFDVSEREHEYVLEGELPGVSDKSSISVDFEDAQTIVIKGEISRNVKTVVKAPEPEQQQQLTEEALQASAAAQEAAKTTTAEGETVVYNDAASTTSSRKSKQYQVTVEDEVDESETSSNASYEVVDGPVLTKASKGKAPVRNTEDFEMTNSGPASKPAQPLNGSSITATKEQAKQPATKYWISERPIGVFERKFKFQGLIDQDNVKATLENGLLTITIPKREAYIRQVFIY